MHNQKGFIGIVCIVLTAGLLLVVGSIHGLIAADYKYTKTYLRQKQCVQAAMSGIVSLEKVVSKDNAEGFVRQWEVSLPPDEHLITTMSVDKDKNVLWLSCRAVIADMDVNVVKGFVGLPFNNHDFYNYDLVSKVFNISPQANVRGATTLNYAARGFAYPELEVQSYQRYARLMPDAEIWRTGVGNNVFYDYRQNNVRLVDLVEVNGSSVFVSEHSMAIGTGSRYPQPTHFIANGNVVVERNVVLSNAFILSGAAVKLSEGSRVKGKIFAKNGIIIERNAEFSGVGSTDLSIVTDRYIY